MTENWLNETRQLAGRVDALSVDMAGVVWRLDARQRQALVQINAAWQLLHAAGINLDPAGVGDDSLPPGGLGSSSS